MNKQNSVDQGTPLRWDAPETRRALERMVTNLTSQRLWHEDLLQEAWIRLWQEEERCPGQSAVWYLRNCQFYLRNWLRHGRSVDSPKRRKGSVVLHARDGASVGLLESMADSTDGSCVLQAVTARDLLSVLLERLTTLEREVLACLADGLGMRETARRLQVSHSCVANKRRSIASLVAELDAQTHTSRRAHHPKGQSQGRNGSATTLQSREVAP